MATKEATSAYSGRYCTLCHNYTTMKDLSFHAFPFSRPKIFKKWTQFVNIVRKQWPGPTALSVICSDHFKKK